MKNCERSEKRSREVFPVEKASIWTVLQKNPKKTLPKNQPKCFVLYKNQMSSVTYVSLSSLWVLIQISDASVYLKTISLGKKKKKSADHDRQILLSLLSTVFRQAQSK